MILNKTPLSLAQVRGYVKDMDDQKPVAMYLKKFCKVSQEDAEKLAGELRALNNHKLREESIIKVIDFLPRDNEELHKIFSDVSLSEEEAGVILALVKNY